MLTTNNSGLFLADLTFIDENKDFVDVKPEDKDKFPPGTKLINFTKQRMVHTAIGKLTKFRSSNYNATISRAEPVFSFLYALPRLCDDALYTISNEVEPRGSDIKSIL